MDAPVSIGGRRAEFGAPDPRFEPRIRESFARQRFVRTLAAKLAHVSAGAVEIDVPPTPSLTQQHGFLHAGAVLAPAAGERWSRAAVVRAGHTLTAWRRDAFSIQDEYFVSVATALATNIRIGSRDAAAAYATDGSELEDAA